MALIGLGGWALKRGTTARDRRYWLTGLGVVGMALLTVLSWWLRPFVADDVALDALESPNGYTVESNLTSWTLMPDSSNGVGLIFQPGARVDARAYASILSDLARTGHPVVIVKQPLGIGFLALGSPASIAKEHPDIDWAVGGHSLGGVAASAAIGDDFDSLLLWASFPASDIDANTEGMSISGSEDNFTTPGDIDETRSRLPEDAEFVVIEGAIHSHFGDYGLQPGDGEAGISREEAQNQIVSASLSFLSSQ